MPGRDRMAPAPPSRLVAEVLFAPEELALQGGRHLVRLHGGNEAGQRIDGLAHEQVALLPGTVAGIAGVVLRIVRIPT